MTDLDDEIKDEELKEVEGIPETEGEEDINETGPVHDFPAHGGHEFEDDPEVEDPHASFDPATHEDDPHFDLYGVKTSSSGDSDDFEDDEEEGGGYYEMSGTDSY